MNFKQANDNDIAFKWLEKNQDKAHDLIFDDVQPQQCWLTAVEDFATDNGLIDSEQNASEMFDKMLNVMLDGMNYRDGVSITDDIIAINEMFSNLMDVMLEKGELHSEQKSEYCYCGEYP